MMKMMVMMIDSNGKTFKHLQQKYRNTSHGSGYGLGFGADRFKRVNSCPILHPILLCSCLIIIIIFYWIQVIRTLVTIRTTTKQK